MFINTHTDLWTQILDKLVICVKTFPVNNALEKRDNNLHEYGPDKLISFKLNDCIFGFRTLHFIIIHNNNLMS